MMSSKVITFTPHALFLSDSEIIGMKEAIKATSFQVTKTYQ